MNIMNLLFFLFKRLSGLSQRGSVGRVPSRKAKGRMFDSQSGHMPELRAQSLVRVQLMFLSHIDVSLPLLLPPFSSLSKNK